MNPARRLAPGPGRPSASEAGGGRSGRRRSRARIASADTGRASRSIRSGEPVRSGAVDTSEAASELLPCVASGPERAGNLYRGASTLNAALCNTQPLVVCGG